MDFHLKINESNLNLNLGLDLSELLSFFLQIQFESGQSNPLGQVVLPPSLLSSASLRDANHSSLSRISFMFFSSTNLFQVSPSCIGAQPCGPGRGGAE